MNQSTRITRRIFLSLVITLASIFLIRGMLASNAPQSLEQREIEDKIPKHVPIKLKIRNEKALKDLKNQRWVQDLELEITNTSEKPIYYLALWVVLPEIISDGMPVGFPLRYGRIQFVDFETRALPEDVPILPGESFTYRIPETYQRGWKARKSREGRPDPKKLQIKFVQLSFGDGTGFNGTNATPYPYTRQGAVGDCRQYLIPGDNIESALIIRIRSSDSQETIFFPTAPAVFLPVSFFSFVLVSP